MRARQGKKRLFDQRLNEILLFSDQLDKLIEVIKKYLAKLGIFILTTLSLIFDVYNKQLNLPLSYRARR